MQGGTRKARSRAHWPGRGKPHPRSRSPHATRLLPPPVSEPPVGSPLFPPEPPPGGVEVHLDGVMEVGSPEGSGPPRGAKGTRTKPGGSVRGRPVGELPNGSPMPGSDRGLVLPVGPAPQRKVILPRWREGKGRVLPRPRRLMSLPEVRRAPWKPGEGLSRASLERVWGRRVPLAPRPVATGVPSGVRLRRAALPLRTRPPRSSRSRIPSREESHVPVRGPLGPLLVSIRLPRESLAEEPGGRRMGRPREERVKWAGSWQLVGVDLDPLRRSREPVPPGLGPGQWGGGSQGPEVRGLLSTSMGNSPGSCLPSPHRDRGTTLFLHPRGLPTRERTEG